LPCCAAWSRKSRATTIPIPRKNDTNYKLGLGLQYAVTESFAVRAEAERYRVNDAVGNRGHIDLVSV
jgi:OOP family OmpA-OmpF porin